MILEASPFSKRLQVPGSKSFANRAFILAAISSSDVFVSNIPKSSDVETMLSCLSKIGLALEYKDGGVWIKGSFPHCERSSGFLELETLDGGTTNRFLTGLLARGSREYHLLPTTKMYERPWEDLIRPMRELGVSIKKESGKIVIKGPYKRKKQVEVNSKKSTQFASSLLMSLSDSETKVIATGLESSERYFQMTKEMIEHLGVRFDTPVDFSSLSYPAALAAISGKCVIENYAGIDTLQADSVLLKLLEQMGSKVSERDGELLIERCEKRAPMDIKCSSFPDLVPTLCFLCSYADGESRLQDLEVLRHKESDRIEEVLKILSLFKVKSRYEDGDLFIEGREKHSEFVVYEAPEDHRMVMTCYLFMKYNGGGELKNSECVKKSFSNFFEVME